MYQAQHIPSALWESAAQRLVAPPNEKAAAKRLVANARAHNIDLNLLWGVVGKTPKHEDFVRQVCLAVLGSGRTAMLFLSSPRNLPSLGVEPVQRQEIASAVRSAIAELPRYAPGKVALAQTLIEPIHDWAREVCEQAGMTFVGRLEYLRRPLSPVDAAPLSIHWPAGIRVRPVEDITDFSPTGDGTRLGAALEASYIDTLDCPELCGLRSTRDVIDSHRGAGAFDPNHWYLVEHEGAPVGCCLMTPSPEQQSVELVYLGVAPSARGLGLGRKLLHYAIEHLNAHTLHEMTCAVDTRNEPALRLYSSMGFEAFNARLGFVAKV